MKEKYLWSGLTTLLAVYDESDNVLMRFNYADGHMPVSMTKGGTTYYFAYDQTGSLKAVADSTGTVVKIIDYDSFGYIISDSDESFKVPFGFAGGLHDRDTGLVRFGYRDYDPELGRWTAKDPILFEGGDSDLYGYVLNDPVNCVDPEGLDPRNLFPNQRYNPTNRTPRPTPVEPQYKPTSPPNITPENYNPRGVNNLPGKPIPESPYSSRNARGASGIFKALNNIMKVFNMGNIGGSIPMIIVNPELYPDPLYPDPEDYCA